jgi:hypothetical protein
MKVVNAITIVLALIVFGCQPKRQIKEEVTSKYPETFANALKAHGGLDTWNSMGRVEFDEITDKDTVNHLIDLKNRNERMEKESQYIVGYTSDSIYFHPDQSSFPGKDPRFYHNLRFYFFALPFVTADPGVNHEVLEPRTILDTECNRVKITFGNEVGFAPKDQYILWYGKKDNLLKMINFSVTYYNPEKAENYNAIVYSKWEEIAGLKVPTEMIGYKWENDSLGDERYRK